VVIKFHLNAKNVLTLVGALAVLGETLISLLVPLDHLVWIRWKAGVIVIAGVGIGSLIWQTFRQSREDDERDDRERKRDENLRTIVGAIGVGAESEVPRLAAVPKTDAVFDAEVQRIFVYAHKALQLPVTQLMEELRPAAGPADVLVRFYVVNCADAVHYIRDIAGSVEANGVPHQFSRQEGFTAPVFRGTVEYGWDPQEDRSAWPVPLPPLLPELPFQLDPRQPITGWVRFALPDVDTEAIDPKTWKFSIIDSLGKEHAITKTAQSVSKKGTIGLRKANEGLF
jgi:hypothetical protein